MIAGKNKWDACRARHGGLTGPRNMGFRPEIVNTPAEGVSGAGTGK